MNESKLHYFSRSISPVELPGKFTYPFHYTPHSLCILAARQVQNYLATQVQWQEELKKGKMFGVLVAQNSAGEIGFLAAFSGILAGHHLQDYFVPPIYDVQTPQGFFKLEEDQISQLNKQIKSLESDKHFLQGKQALSELCRQAAHDLAEAKEELKKARALREQLRQNSPTAAQLARLIRESQFQKAGYKRLERHWKVRIEQLKTATDQFEHQIEKLKNERKIRSAALQQKLFEQFNLLNNRGEVKNLGEIFKETAHKTPPAGAGECAAPKLLQYAYQNHLHPVAMAEFWWGDSPKTEIRRHGYYYPACKGKCEPILKHMLQGLNVEENPLEKPCNTVSSLEILYEDEWLAVVNKPTGMLSVPGKSSRPSIGQLFKTCYPQATGPLIVHRLDMATSGVLLLAKTKEVHKLLQAQFKDHTIKKRYVALLDGRIPNTSGKIDLPLCPDPLDRPRQIVSPEHGKPAITRYEVIEQREHHTLIAFYPLTGRTHQLRVHAAHPLGLNTPIQGDELYGKQADRLYLHAQQIEFQHPVTRQTLCIKKDINF